MKKRIMSSVLALLMLISVLSCGSLSASAATVATDACDSVVVIAMCFDSEEKGLVEISFGTGFFIGSEASAPSNLLTNFHVISDFFQAGQGSRTTVTYKYKDTSGKQRSIRLTGRAIIKVYYDSNDSVEAYYVEGNEKKDVALLKLASPTSKRRALKICEPTNDMRGSQIYAIGYPSVADNNLKTSTSKWGKDDATITGGSFSKLFTESGTGNNMVQLGFEISPGNSGGPIINSDGNVIGIATENVTRQYYGQGILYTEQMNYARSISDAIPFLKRNSVEYDTAQFGQSTGNNGNSQINQNDVNPGNQGQDNTGSDETQNNNETVAQTEAPTEAPTEALTEAPTEAPTEAAKEDSSSNVLVIVLIVIIALLVLGGGTTAIVLVMNKNKKAAEAAANEAKAMAAAAAEKAATKTPYVRSMSAQHGNARIKMTPGIEIVMGRSRDCKIVYKENTPGVSGKHCSISYDGATKSFILKDLKSTYGTFLQDGTKITPNTPYRLRSGDRFYLGDKGNMICVELE